MSVLSQEARRCWGENGYTIIRDAVPEENLLAVIQAVSAFLKIDPEDPSTWYHDPPRRLGFVEMYHHQALWDNRQYPRIHEGFSEIWGTPDLWVSFDRANMTPPERSDRPSGFNEPLIHWDFGASLSPDKLMVQGVLCLTNTEEDQGGFQCVPGFHRQFQEWVAGQPADRNPDQPDLEGLEIQQVAAEAGDLIIWNSLLPHGNSLNTSNQPRWSQYILMTPAEPDNEAKRAERIDMWRHARKPADFPGDPRYQEPQTGGPARLTDLGRKLLGLDLWR